VGYRFGAFRYDAEREELWRGDTLVPLNRKALQLLLVLIERRGELVTKQDLFNLVWPQRGATLNNVSQHIFMLRQALEDSTESHDYILTVPRAGYRFIAPVEQLGAESPNRILAQHYCANARELWQMRTQSSLESAIALYNRAIEQHAEHAEAHAGLALCRFLLGDYMFEPGQQMLRLAEADARRALEVDPNNTDAIIISAIAAMQLRYAWKDAEQLLFNALRIDPKKLWAHIALVEHYAMLGELTTARQALTHAESAAGQDEPFPRLPMLRGLLHYLSGAQTAAIAELELLVAHYPRYALARFVLAKALLVYGEPEAARAQVQEILRMGFDPLRPGQPNVRERALAINVLIGAANRDPEAAREATRAFEAEMQGRPISAVCHATCALARDEHALAMRYLETAIANHDPLVGYIAGEPIFAPLRSHPQWPHLLAALNLTAS
jgi:DNA-binding winged helix-turn-helix (wHTH) protein/Tfp pilus assembly protein PilF